MELQAARSQWWGATAVNPFVFLLGKPLMRRCLLLDRVLAQAKEGS